MFRVYLTADFDTEEEAASALSDLEEAVGRHNGDLQQTETENLDEVFGG